MPKTTPFHSRLDALNQTRVWKNWSGYLVAPKFQHSITTEYYAIRGAVSLFDTSPLFKYKLSGPASVELLKRSLVRNVERCRIGQAQYTAWCDEQGFVVQDGVVLRTGESEFWLTSAEPSLRYFRQIARSMTLSPETVQDVSTDFGILALQGPLSYEVLSQLTVDIGRLGYFGVCKSTIANCPVMISRTGFTGDLGYEIWVDRNDAIAAWDALVEAGSGFNLIPVGSTALKMARVEAGLMLLGVDFHSSRYAWVDAQRETPAELGWSWMLRGISKDDRNFIGKEAIEAEMNSSASRWKTVGVEVDWHDYERVHRQAGIATPKFEHYLEETMSIYRRSGKQWDYAGYASSFLFSSLLKKPIAIAKLPLDLSQPGCEIDLELTVIRKPETVKGRVVPMPFFNPPQKTASMKANVQT